MIQVVAFDMDGTFLNSHNDYDRARCARVFDTLLEKGIRIVAISGNQYQQIKSFFPDYADRMTIVSEVGAQIVENGQRIKEWCFKPGVVATLLHILGERELLDRCMVNGLQAVYYPKAAPTYFKDLVHKHNHVCVEVESLLDLPEEDLTLLAMNLPEVDIDGLLDELNQASQGQARAVSSGMNFIDIVQPGVNKGVALDFLAKRWGVTAEQIIAFGDSGNDLDMLLYATHSYAMEGSPQIVQDTARYLAPSNDASGVLAVLEEVVLGVVG